MRILLAEDERTLAQTLKLLLQKQNYCVDAVYSGTDALEYLSAASYDALILDIMMPGLDGLQVLRTARQQGVRTPALFLTALSEVDERVAGLDAGADDYLPKPFDTAELLARVRALVRRSGSYALPTLRLGATALDCGRYMLCTSSGELQLNHKEFQLMELFFRNPRQVFSAQRLMERVWGIDASAGLDVVWTYIGFLRRKLRHLHADVQIATLRGAGYALETAR